MKTISRWSPQDYENDRKRRENRRYLPYFKFIILAFLLFVACCYLYCSNIAP